uniref:Small EDRK-rich factor-like N-terminal domain-containing protein n=1 Tax=Salix viminalis TaxID=40686 RepID=A0A6N2MB24_SALVM
MKTKEGKPNSALQNLSLTNRKTESLQKDRERAQARGGNKGNKGKDDGLTPEQRRERDAKALQEKAAKKAAQAVGGGSSGGGKGNNKK